MPQNSPKTDAVLIHDTGTGKVFSIALENLWETAPLMSEIYRPLQEVFDLQPLSTRYFGASDHVEFLDKGVPAYFCIQLPDHYREAHHSQTDTFDKVIPDQINEGRCVSCGLGMECIGDAAAVAASCRGTEPSE